MCKLVVDYKKNEMEPLERLEAFVKRWDPKKQTVPGLLGKIIGATKMGCYELPQLRQSRALEANGRIQIIQPLTRITSETRGQ